MVNQIHMKRSTCKTKCVYQYKKLYTDIFSSSNFVKRPKVIKTNTYKTIAESYIVYKMHVLTTVRRREEGMELYRRKVSLFS